MIHKVWSSIEEVHTLLFFKVFHQISRSHRAKNCRFWPKLGVYGLQLEFEFIDGYEMMHKAWSSIEEVPYCFSRSSIKLQGNTGQKIADFDPSCVFQDCSVSLNTQMRCCTKLEVARRAQNFLTQIGCFRTVTPVWIHHWLWNDGQSLT